MNLRTVLLLLSYVALFSCTLNSDHDQALLTKKDVEKVVFLGGSMISSMEDHPYLEVAMTKYYHGNPISFRNIGWAADDVFGMARSQFGSAQNTKSWKPPSAEEGFGSTLLKNHIKETNPTTLFIGYGNEAAFFTEEEEFNVFRSGYVRLLDFVDSLGTKIVLLSAQRHTISENNTKSDHYNSSIQRVNKFINSEAQRRNLIYIDLYHKMYDENEDKEWSVSGFQLSEDGHKKMAEVILETLAIPNEEYFDIKLDEKGEILSCENCTTSSWESTVNGIRFKLEPEAGIYQGMITSPNAVSAVVDGVNFYLKDDRNEVSLQKDAFLHQRLVSTIKEKNNFYRNRLRPLNEAYIYLFRQHEMGHLAYEMDDLLELVNEKEEEINGLVDHFMTDIEIHLYKPYKAPKSYADDEIPAFIPDPDIPSELAAFHVQEGYEISLFASDPMIANPININWDDQGRAWVATSSTYPHIVPGKEPNDRIVILEDTDDDGKADKHTVFAENLLVPHSVMPVKGGAYVTATTQLLFLADVDGDDVADEKHVVFDGFGNADVHHTIHGLRWMPWGDLHFTQGFYINSFIETARGVKKLNGSGIWSFRPEKHHLEVYSRGLVNPWGEAVDHWGQTLATDGAGGSGPNYVFPESAHMTAVGASKVLNGLREGSPKYTAADIVNNTHFPESWQGSLVTNDFRANRTVRFSLTPKQSSYKAVEEEVLLFSEHRSYRPVDSKFGPDGALYIVDWYNPIIDHGEVDFYHPKRDKVHGRIWRLKKKDADLLQVVNMKELTVEELLDLFKSKNQLDRLRANRALVDRNVDPAEVTEWLSKQRVSAVDFAHHRLEVLWLLAALNHYDQGLLKQALASNNHRERAAAVRLIAHHHKQDELFEELEQSIVDDHPQVRLETLNALRTMETMEAVTLAMKVLGSEMDEYLDFALSLLLESSDDIWLDHLSESKELFAGDLGKQLYAFLRTKDKSILPYLNILLESDQLSKEQKSQGWLHMALIGDGPSKYQVLRKAVAEEDLDLLAALNRTSGNATAIPQNVDDLSKLLDSDSIGVVIEGIRLIGNWEANQFADKLEKLANTSGNSQVLLESNRALADLRRLDKVKTIAVENEELQKRAVSTAVWIENDPEEALNNSIALLKTVEDSDQAEIIFDAYKRTDKGPELLTEALAKESLPEAIASVGLRVVQTSGLNLSELEQAIRMAGSIESIGLEMTDEEKENLIAEAMDIGDRERGRRVYRRSDLMCGSCHVVDKEGGLSGPFLGKIGSFMTPRSVLESVINPNAVIKQNYETLVITKKNAEVISGVLHRKTSNAVLIRKANGEIEEISEDDIEKSEISSNSLMPTGLTQNLHKDELRDLIAYLMSLGVEQ